jgi:hypothetical protein
MSARPIQRLGAAIEIHAPCPDPGPIRHAVLDFDGTLSLIRAGWQEIMLALCVETIELETARSKSLKALGFLPTQQHLFAVSD